MNGGQGGTWESWFVPSTTWMLGVELMSSGWEGRCIYVWSCLVGPGDVFKIPLVMVHLHRQLAWIWNYLGDAPSAISREAHLRREDSSWMLVTPFHGLGAQTEQKADKEEAS